MRVKMQSWRKRKNLRVQVLSWRETLQRPESRKHGVDNQVGGPQVDHKRHLKVLIFYKFVVLIAL